MPSSGADATWGELAPVAALVGRNEAAADNAGMQRRIVGYHQDAERHWVAELDCGHNQHVRHQPPWTHRPWVISPGGRAAISAHSSSAASATVAPRPTPAHDASPARFRDLRRAVVTLQRGRRLHAPPDRNEQSHALQQIASTARRRIG